MNPASAKTSLNQIPALVSKLMENTTLFPPKAFSQPVIFDFGAGKKGKLDSFFFEKQIGYLPYDPFNRSNGENFDALIEIGDANFAICCNVLNVLEDDALMPTIAKLHKLTMKTKKGVCFLSVYHKPSLPINRQIKGHFQRNQPIEWYIPHLEKYFGTVRKEGKFLVCKA
jgi:hypothetical protein